MGKSIGSDSPYQLVIKIEYRRFFRVPKVPICWYPKFDLSAGLLIKAENAMDTPLFSRKFLFSLADLALP